MINFLAKIIFKKEIIMTKKRRKLKKKRIIFATIVVLLLILSVIVLILSFNKKNKNDITIVKENKISIKQIKEKYNHLVKADTNIIIYNDKKEEVGKIIKDSSFILDDNYEIVDEYYKLDSLDYYVKYNNISKIDTLDIDNFSEYENYQYYIPFNKNIVTNDSYSLKVNDNIYYELKGSNTYEIIIKDDDKYGIIFNNRLVYIDKDDVYEEIDNDNDNDYASSLSALNYHYTISKEAGETNECVQEICMLDTQIEEEIKYLVDTNHYMATMRDVELFVSEKIHLPLKSVAITIDDG